LPKKASLLLKFITYLDNFITNKSNFIAVDKARRDVGDTDPPKSRLAAVEAAERARNLRVAG
jgi:hypothetical protein